MVVSGSSVQLVCNYEYNREREDPLYSVKWYRNVNQFYEYIPKREPQVRVYPLPNLNVDVSFGVLMHGLDVDLCVGERRVYVCLEGACVCVCTLLTYNDEYNYSDA